METFSLPRLLQVYEQKYPYHNLADVHNGLLNFSHAELVPDPICLRGRSWEEIKRRITEEIKLL